MNDVKTEPCLKGLTEECFHAHPDYAKRVFAYRLLMLLIGEQLVKRLQTIPGGFWARALPELPGVPPQLTVVIPPFTPVPPIFIPTWEPGPIITSQPTQEEDAVPAIHKAVINIATAATHEIVAAVAGFKISIASIAFTVAGETNLTLCSAATPISGAMDFGGTNEPRGLTHAPGEYSLQTVAGEAFQIINSAAIQVSGYVTYYLS